MRSATTIASRPSGVKYMLYGSSTGIVRVGLPVRGIDLGERVARVVRDVQVLQVVRRERRAAAALRRRSGRRPERPGVDDVDRVRLRVRDVDPPAARCARRRSGFPDGPRHRRCACRRAWARPPWSWSSSRVPAGARRRSRRSLRRHGRRRAGSSPAGRRPRGRNGPSRASRPRRPCGDRVDRLDRRGRRVHRRASPPITYTRLPSAAAAACVVGLGRLPIRVTRPAAGSNESTASLAVPAGSSRPRSRRVPAPRRLRRSGAAPGDGRRPGPAARGATGRSCSASACRCSRRRRTPSRPRPRLPDPSSAPGRPTSVGRPGATRRIARQTHVWSDASSAGRQRGRARSSGGVRAAGPGRGRRRTPQCRGAATRRHRGRPTPAGTASDAVLSSIGHGSRDADGELCARPTLRGCGALGSRGRDRAPRRPRRPGVSPDRRTVVAAGRSTARRPRGVATGRSARGAVAARGRSRPSRGLSCGTRDEAQDHGGAAPGSSTLTPRLCSRRTVRDCFDARRARSPNRVGGPELALELRSRYRPAAARSSTSSPSEMVRSTSSRRTT